MYMLDFNHTKFVFSSTMIGIKPITIKEHCFKILIPGKVIVNYVFNDPVLLRFMSFYINNPRNNSYISCVHRRVRSFKNGSMKVKPIDVIPTITFDNNTSVR
jgi:hypothetical protein